MAVGHGEGWLAEPAATPQEVGGKGGQAVADAASGTAVAAAALLAPKRKKKGNMKRVCTLSAFNIECDCRSTKTCTPLSHAASLPASRDSGPAPVPAVRCSYYEAAREWQHSQWQLYSFLEAPAALRFNPHIRSGYRAGYSYPQCCRSVLSWHNETTNIWSHLLPALVLLVLLAGGQLQVWQGARLAFAANVGSIVACFLGSALYHTFMAHHHEHDKWLKLDVCGILLVLVGGGHMVLWWGLACHPAARATYALLYYGCAAVCIWAALNAVTAAGRGLPMLALLCIRLGAFVTRVLLEPSSAALRHYALMEACSLTGGMLNVFRIPERCLQPKDPAKAAPLDYFLNSHQVMHVLVAAAMWQLHLGATADYRTVSALLDGTMQCRP